MIDLPGMDREDEEIVYVDITKEDNQSTNNLVNFVLQKLNYNIKDYKERKKIVDDIYKECGDSLDRQFCLYQESNLKKYINKLYYDKLNTLFNTLNNYLLFAESDKSISKPKFYKDDDFVDGSSNTISLEKLVREEMNQEEGTDITERIKKYYDDYNHAKYSLEKLRKDMSECPYVDDYINYNIAARNIIENTVVDNIKTIDDEEVNIYAKRKNKNEQIPIVITDKKKKFTKSELKILSRSIGYRKNNSIEIDKDIISIMKEYFRYIYFKSPLIESEEIDYDQFDFTDKNQLLALLRFKSKGNFESDLGCLLYDLNQLLSKINLTDIEKKIINLYREDIKVSQEDIANQLNVSQRYISGCLDKICNKIIKLYWNKLEDWYYLNIVKGHYKKCSVCGETKLVNEKYFSINKSSKDGFSSVCKKCRKANNFVQK